MAMSRVPDEDERARKHPSLRNRAHLPQNRNNRVSKSLKLVVPYPKSNNRKDHAVTPTKNQTISPSPPYIVNGRIDAGLSQISRMPLAKCQAHLKAIAARGCSQRRLL